MKTRVKSYGLRVTNEFIRKTTFSGPPLSLRLVRNPSVKERFLMSQWPTSGNDNSCCLTNEFISKSSKGFTLIEVLIALTILAIGLLGVALMQVTSISGNTFSREMSVATELGQDVLEKLRTYTYTETTEDNALIAGSHPDTTDVSNGLAVGVGNLNIIDERGLTVGPLIYTRTWEVTNNSAGVISNPNLNMKTITVTVRWTEKGAAATTRSITITGVKVRS